MKYWRMTDEQREALLAVVRDNAPVKARSGVTLLEAYAFALGELRGRLETMLSGMERIEPEDMVDVPADETAELF